MSTTEALSETGVDCGSGVPDSDHNHLKQTPTSSKRRKAQRAPNLPEDIEHEIDNLYHCVPQITQVFEVVDRIGSGTFSSVYLAGLRQHREVKQQFALKHIIPTSHPSRIENELRCLQEIGGCDYVMGVKACIREKDHVVIVMPYFPHDRFQDYVQSMDLAEIREYMRALLTALRRVHEVQIIHRDVKPSNFLYNRSTKQYSLVDFGLAMKVPGLKEEKPVVGNTTAGKKPRTRTSPRTTSKCSRDKTSPKKCKLSNDDEENKAGGESPRKQRPSNESSSHRLAELDVNVIERHDANDDDAKTTTTTGGVGKQNYNAPPRGAVKSPRRMLLTKRALDLQQRHQQQTEGGGNGGLFDKSDVGAGANTGVSAVLTKVTGNGVYSVGGGSSKTVGGGSAVGSVSGKTPSGGLSSGATCRCFGKPQICSVCIARSSQHAPRAGTQGFRSPEVLMKYPDQTTAVDMWSAGVILLSLLSGRYPFFKAQDDLSALAQVISVFGTENMQRAARSYDKHLLSNPVMPSLDLCAMCLKLRGVGVNKASTSSSCRKSSIDRDPWSSSGHEAAFDLLRGLLELNPHTRLSAEHALSHSFFDERN